MPPPPPPSNGTLRTRGGMQGFASDWSWGLGLRKWYDTPVYRPKCAPVISGYCLQSALRAPSSIPWVPGKLELMVLKCSTEPLGNGTPPPSPAALDIRCATEQIVGIRGICISAKLNVQKLCNFL